MAHPPAEVQVDAPLVQRLLRSQCPWLAEESLVLLDEGWDNVTFRLGDTLAVRLPRRELAVELLLNEGRWLPVLAPRLPVQVPEVLHLGEPGSGFPWPWHVVRWVDGTTAEDHAFGGADVDLLARTLLALHQEAPDDAPENPFRGLPLARRAQVHQDRAAELGAWEGVDLERCRAAWDDACAAPPAAARRWLHGDLHPRNVVVRDGRFAGLLDWGDVNGGDPATDLACAWTLLESPSLREGLFRGYGASEDEVRRARGWAVYMGVALAASGEPRHIPLGWTFLRRVTQDTTGQQMAPVGVDPITP